MTALEIILVLFLTVFAVLGLFALAYLAVIMPIKEELFELKEIGKKERFKTAFQQKNVALPLLTPANELPSLDDLPESVFDIGDYGEDKTTPEEADEKMSEVEQAAREAETSWKELESLRHGKSNPLLYSGN